MGVFQPDPDGGPEQGLVFNGGTTDWPRVLAESRVVVDQITRNVVRRFIGLPPRVVARGDTILNDSPAHSAEPAKDGAAV